MHPDKKLGLALGILLIGVTGALFFRNEKPQSDLRLQNPQSLDDQIAQQQGPKPHINLERPEPIDEDDSLTSNSPTIGRMWSPQTRSKRTDSPAAIDLQQTDVQQTDVQEPALPPVRTMPPDKIAKSAAPPDPIPTGSPRHENDPIPLPRGNRGWEAVASTSPIASARTAGTSPPASPMRRHVVRRHVVRRHVVRRGETLSGLASRYLGSSARFAEIYRVNRDQLRSPGDLRVGMSIRIPPQSAKKSNSTQHRSKKPVVAKSSGSRAASSRRVPARSVSRETSRKANPRVAGTTKSQPAPHRKRRLWFVPVRRSPFLRRPRGHSSKKPPAVSRKKLSQLPPTDLPASPKKKK